MLRGSIVIANDLLGVLEETSDGGAVIIDRFGKKHTVKESALTEVVTPYAHAAKVILKLRGRVGK